MVSMKRELVNAAHSLSHGARRMSPFFSVKRERLNRKDGNDTRYDALYRRDDGSQLSVVSRDYKLITHRQVIDFVHHALRDYGIKYKVQKSEVASNGAKMFHVIKFPDYKFNAAGDGRGKNTALDGKKNKDEYIPTLIVRNSYDKTSRCDIDYGGYRVVCSNGMVVGVRIERVNIIHFGKEDVEKEFEELREPLINGILKTVDGLKGNFERLNHESGEDYFEKLLYFEALAKKYKKEMLARMFPFVDVEYEKDEETGKDEPVGFKVKQQFSAYLLYCIMTGIATHMTKTVLAKHRMNELIAEQFKV